MRLSQFPETEEFIEDMILGFVSLVWWLARELLPDFTHPDVMVKRWAHKAEIVDDLAGGLWYNKACPSSRLATTCVDTTMESKKCKRFYMYLGAVPWTRSKQTCYQVPWCTRKIGHGQLLLWSRRGW